MAYSQKEWLAKPARTTEEIRAPIMELPDRGPAITKDDPEFSTMEQQRLLGLQPLPPKPQSQRLARPWRLCNQQHSPCRNVCQSKGWVSESDCRAAFPQFRLELGL